MGKRKGFDIIEDAHELAQHNYGHPYWVNRVTSYTYATWMAEKKISVFMLPFVIFTWIFLFRFLSDASAEGTSVWKVIFNFSDSASTAWFVSLLYLIFYTLITTIAAVQTLTRKPPPKIEIPKEKRKKYPKRRKDYGRD